MKKENRNGYSSKGNAYEFNFQNIGYKNESIRVSRKAFRIIIKEN
jgi:hypothetical protein